MGGGVGVSAHGGHRVVTERTRLAMPETSIGFFPDVGATWLLSHAPGEVGTYLALTGATIGATDAIDARLADSFVMSADLPALQEALASLDPSANAADVAETLASLLAARRDRHPAASPRRDRQAHGFGRHGGDPRALERDGSAFAAAASRA